MRQRRATSPESYLGIIEAATGDVTLLGPTIAGLDDIAWLTSARPPHPPEVSPPGAAIPLMVGQPAPGLLELKWEPTLFADSYRVLAGYPEVLWPMIGVVPGNTTRRQCGIPTTSVTIPIPAGNVFFLVAADNAAGTGSLGFGSFGPPARQGDLICP